MKNIKLLIVLILFLQGLCYAGFAQTTDPCKPQEPQEKPEDFPSQPDPQPVEDVDIPSEAPIDPNEIIGLIGYDAVGSADTFRWVSATQTLAYIGYFENDADFAIAAANKAMVTHSNVFNFNEFIHTNTELNTSLYC